MNSERSACLSIPSVGWHVPLPPGLRNLPKQTGLLDLVCPLCCLRTRPYYLMFSILLTTAAGCVDSQLIGLKKFTVWFLRESVCRLWPYRLYLDLGCFWLSLLVSILPEADWHCPRLLPSLSCCHRVADPYPLVHLHCSSVCSL